MHDRNDDYYGKKGKKPDSGFYQQKSSDGGKRYDRNFNTRQGSEPRGQANFGQDSMKGGGYNDRSRDTRSSEPGGNHYKPPSGQPRISNAALQRLPLNIDSLPPRLKKKVLLDAGLSEDLVDKPIMEMMQQQQSYSNTLPTGRGRNNNNRYDYHNNYSTYRNQQNYHNDYEHRSLTPPLSKASRLQQHQQQPQKPPQQPQTPRQFEWKNERREEETKKDDGNFDWSEDVLNSQSLPHDVNVSGGQQKYEEGGHRRHRRRRNRR
jgi:hypothetical protein